jgi:hypothetical protein
LWGLFTNQYSRPIGRLSQSGADGALSVLATITFLGEQGDATDPERRALFPGRRRNANVLSTISEYGHAHQVIREAVISSWTDGSALTPSGSVPEG